MKTPIRIVFALLAACVIGAGCKSQAPAPVAEISGKFRDIYAGAADVFVLMDDGTLWGAGYNRSGQLGLGGVSRGEPAIARIDDIEGNPFLGVKSVAAGENHTVILKEDGTLWGAGDSSYGELGMEKGRLLVFSPLKAGDGALSGVKAAAAGNNSVFFIDSGGGLWASGYNYYGELGLGGRDAQLSFVRAESAGRDIKALASGLRHTVLLKEDGSLWVAGYNFNGQLGLGDAEDRNSFTEAASAGTGIRAVAAGNYHTAILKNDGSVWTSGSNYWGQLGFAGSGDLREFTRVLDENGGPLAGVKEIAARGNITALLKEDGSLLLAGNYAAPEGREGPDPEAFFVDGDDPAGKLDTAKSSFIPLAPEEGAASQFKGVKKIVLGYSSVYAISEDNLLWAAGSNRYGQLSLSLDTEISPALKRIEQSTPAP